MTFPDDQILPPDQIGAALAGDAGNEVQAEQMKLWVPQYVALTMSRAPPDANGVTSSTVTSRVPMATLPTSAG